MPVKTTLNATNLKALGAERLAALLIEISEGNATAKRRLRLELAGAGNPAAVGREVRKRLTAIGRSQSYVDWQKRKTLVTDLKAQRGAIVDQVAKTDATDALDLMWRFMALAGSILERCDDSSGTVMAVFQEALADLGVIAGLAKSSPEELAGQICRALQENDYGQYDQLIPTMAPALGPLGLNHLRRLLLDLTSPAQPVSSDRERHVIGWGSSGPIYAEEYEARRNEAIVRMALTQIADAQSDVDAFIALQGERSRTVPAVAAGIALRLLAAGRTEEAWQAIDAIEERRPDWIPREWEEVKLDVLEALGRKQEAQTFRWSCFEQSLDARHLRDYLKRLPDFEDFEAERRALSFAVVHPSVHHALVFLVNWPALDRAAHMVLSRASELDGDHYEVLTPAADALEQDYPLAATVLRRAMVDFALENQRTKRYRHAATHLMQCGQLAKSVVEFGSFVTHDAYLGRLKAHHGRKSSFWSLIR
jgi:hypothetical protein